jgi:hypothetical protein
MDRERWPDAIAQFVDGVACPRCGAPRALVMVTVRWQKPVWNIISNCTSCNFMHLWQHINGDGSLEPKAEATPLPAWVKGIG